MEKRLADCPNEDFVPDPSGVVFHDVLGPFVEDICSHIIVAPGHSKLCCCDRISCRFRVGKSGIKHVSFLIIRGVTCFILFFILIIRNNFFIRDLVGNYSKMSE